MTSFDSNLKPSDVATLLDRIAPISQGAGAVNGAWVKASDFAQVLAAIHAGVLGAAATLDAKLQQATDGAGTGAKDVPNSSITQMVKATDDGKFSFINMDVGRAIDAANGFAYVRMVVTVGVAASLISAELFGLNPRYGIAAHNAALAYTVSV
jgi:hypothetical protein